MTLSNKLSNRSSKGTARLRKSQVLPQPLFKKWAGWAPCCYSDDLLLACVYVGDNSNMTLCVDDHTCFTILTLRYNYSRRRIFLKVNFTEPRTGISETIA